MEPMLVEDAEALIAGGVQNAGGVWADLGAGTGTFTLALANLLGEGGTVHAVDASGSALAQLERRARGLSGARVVTTVGDFTEPLSLDDLDGVLMANSLHFVDHRTQRRVLAAVSGFLGAGGALVLVEYDVARGNMWVPFPVPLERFVDLAQEVGLGEPLEVGRRRSAYGPRDMYAAVARKQAGK